MVGPVGVCRHRKHCNPHHAALMEAYYAARDQRDAEIESITALYAGDLALARDRGLRRIQFKQFLLGGRSTC